MRGFKVGDVLKVRDTPGFSYIGGGGNGCEKLSATGYRGMDPLFGISFSRTYADVNAGIHITEEGEGVICGYFKSETQPVCKECPLNDRRSIRITNLKKTRI
jgi:hypothetical protein